MSGAQQSATRDAIARAINDADGGGPNATRWALQAADAVLPLVEAARAEARAAALRDAAHAIEALPRYEWRDIYMVGWDDALAVLARLGEDPPHGTLGPRSGDDDASQEGEHSPHPR